MNAPRHLRFRPSVWLHAAAVLVACAAPGLSSAADTIPKFRHGEWEFTRRAADAPKDAQAFSVKECVNPTDAIRNQNEMLAKVGCQFVPPKVSGNTYTYEAECNIANVGLSRSRSVLTRISDSAYTVAVESEGLKEGKPIKTAETLTARRLGDCPKQQ